MDSFELVSNENLCIVDEPAPCKAACPLHVDLISFISKMEEEKFQEAYKILNKKIPFTRIICRICDHPCESECLRNDLGGAIQISKLEKIAVEFGYTVPRKKLPIPRKNYKIAVIGGGISGLIAATTLDKKGYNTTIYEAKSRLGGRLWEFSADELPKELLKEEINKKVLDKKIKVNLNIEVGKDIKIEEILDNYDAVYLGTAFWLEELEINLETFQTEREKLFAGGRLIKDHNDSIIQSVSTGLRAVNSIIRFVNNKSLTASREEEGSYKSSLEINLSHYQENKKYNLDITAEGIKEEAALEARRCFKCQCTECMEACAHLQRFDINPKKYIRQINHNQNIVLGNHRANDMINSCTLCGLCGLVCPNSLNMEDIILEIRQSMVERDKMPPSAHDFALKDMEFNNSRNFKLLKHQPGRSKSNYIFFPGCQMGSSGSEYVPKVYQYLMDNLEDVGLMFSCCGAPAEWAGRMELFKQSLEKLKDDWKKMGEPTFILACSTCYKVFKNNLPEIEIVSLWDLILEEGLPEEAAIDNRRNKGALSIHDACTTRYDENIHHSVRKIVKELGYDISELEYSKEKTECCGYGGLVYYANREQAEDFIKKRINESSQDYLAYCFMCKDLFLSQGKRTLHLLDLIYGKNLDRLLEDKGPTLSERHQNRTKLKLDMLHELWGENMNELEKDDDLNLIIPEDVIESMEDRLILKENIHEVVKYAEETDNKFVNPKNDHLLVYEKIANVTYWVEYEKNKDSYVVEKVYSHRMTIVEE